MRGPAKRRFIRFIGVSGAVRGLYGCFSGYGG